MKKLFMFSALAAAMLMQLGCSKVESPSYYTRDILVTLMPSTNTKTTLEYNGDDTAAPSELVWSPGDQVSYFYSEDNGTTWSVSSSAEVNPGSTITLSNAPAGAFKLRVIYPTVVDGSPYSEPTIFSTQSQPIENELNGNELPMKGEADIAAGAAEATVNYQILGCVVRVKLYSTSSFTENIQKVWLEMVDAASAAVLHRISIEPRGGFLSNAQTGEYLYFAVPATDNAYPMLHILTDDNLYSRKVPSTPVGENYAAATIKRLSFDLSGTTCESTPRIDSDGPANCYLADGSGSYVFDATVIGNGPQGILTGFHTDDASISPKSIKLVWQDRKSETTPVISSVSIVAGEIAKVTVTDLNGNAVVAVYDGTDPASANILWSWHIWHPETSLADVLYSTFGDSPTTFYMLDRNLGATIAGPDTTNAEKVKTFGLLYQWGRKDPITTSSAFTSVSTIPVYSDGLSDIDFLARETQATLLEAVRTPMTFYCVNSGTNNIWEKSGNSHLWDASKTIYDPCPAGYKVPHSDVWKIFTKTGEEVKLVNSYDPFPTSYINCTDYQSISGGYLFYTSAWLSGPTSWYPCAGYRSSEQGSITNSITNSQPTTGHYWSYNPVNDYKMYFLSFVQIMNNKNSARVSPADGSATGHRASGKSVRCVKE